jgi:hypothetical protein
MTRPRTAGAAPEGPAPASFPAASGDGEILAIWQALRATPDLNARCATDAIGRLLDQRLANGTSPSTFRTISGPQARVSGSVLRAGQRPPDAADRTRVAERGRYSPAARSCWRAGRDAQRRTATAGSSQRDLRAAIRA